MPNEVSSDLTTSDLVVEARQIEHHYDAAQPVLRGVDFIARRGSVTALIGANGSGKSTLSRILAGILEPTAGVVRRFGRELPAGANVSAPSARLGYVSQDAALDPEMTGHEILLLFAALYGLSRAHRVQRLAELAMCLGLESWLDQRVDTLSGGQRRRLHLAAGMIHDPELLCLDEPGVGLDPDGVSLLWGELENRAQAGRSVVIVTHDLTAAERHADYVAILDRGQLVASGSPQELVAEHPPSLREVYQQFTGREPEDLEPAGQRQKLRRPGRRRHGGMGTGGGGRR